jgi:hypothetical protein
MPHPFFDAVSYPWDRTDAQALHQGLAGAVPEFTDITFLYQKCKTGLPGLGRDRPDRVWKEALDSLTLARALEKLCELVLESKRLDNLWATVRAIQVAEDPPVGNAVPSSSELDAPAKLFCNVLVDHLGEDAPEISRALVELIRVELIKKIPRISSAELFDATRFAIEYHFLKAKQSTPLLVLDYANGKRALSDEFLWLLNQGLAKKNLREITVDVSAHYFFSRTLEREGDWRAYFDSVRKLAPKSEIGSTLCRIRTDGFVSPQFLIAGLLPRFEDDWSPIIKEYLHQIGRNHTPFVAFQASLWNTWLMWGPSIPICTCDQWDDAPARGTQGGGDPEPPVVSALQCGYGDENNSMPIVRFVGGKPTPFENIKDPSVGAVVLNMTGPLRWAPWLLCRSHRDEPAVQRSGEVPIDVRKYRAAIAQRHIYEADRREANRRGIQRDGLLLQVDEIENGGAAQPSYFTAYLWLMFVVAQKPEPGGALKRLSGDYPELTDLPADRAGKKLWRELLPVYVHANIADAEALDMQRRSLVNNAICLLRELWNEQPKLFPRVDRSRLCFYLVGGSDYSGCGNQIRFPSRDPLVNRLRDRVAADPDREFAAAIFLPSEDETQATRPPQLALFYSTCHLPDLVTDYYEYVDRTAAG